MLTIACTAPLAAFAHSSQRAPSLTYERAGENRFLFNVEMTSGTRVRHVVYMKERLGGKWWIQIRHAMGLSIESRTGDQVGALTQTDARELMGMLFESIRLDHEGRLDEIQIDVQSIESLQESGVSSLRAATIPPKHEIFKSRLLLSAAIAWLQNEDLVKAACADLAFLQRKCKQRPVGMNPLGFRHELQLERWEDAMNVPDLGIRWDSMWFAIDLEPADPRTRPMP